MTTTAFILRRQPADLQRLLDTLHASPLVHIVDAAATTCRARTALQGAKVDALVCDLRFDDGDALALVSELAHGEPNSRRTRVLALAAASDDKLLFEALLAGADGYYVDRGDAMRGVDLAVAAVVRGESQIDALVARQVLNHFDQPLGHCGLLGRHAVDDFVETGSGSRRSRLDAGQRRLVTMISQGISIAALARDYALKPSEIGLAMREIYRKMQRDRLIDASALLAA
jgi:DNA-binding NarL/FixJ family response regulator